MCDIEDIPPAVAFEPDPPNYDALDIRTVADRLYDTAFLYHRYQKHNQHFERCCDLVCCDVRKALGIVGYNHGYKRLTEPFVNNIDGAEYQRGE